MDSRHGVFNIPRRSIPTNTVPPPVDAIPPPPPYSLLPDRPPPLPPRLRSSKSAGRLHESYAHQHQNQQRLERPPPVPLSRDKQAVTLPPGFVFEDASSAQCSSNNNLLSPPLPDRPIRRAKSSTDLRRPQTSSGLGGGEEPLLKSESSWKKAFDEAQYFAGGLISSPVESTRHHSVIRHSSALVWYRGPGTSVTLTFLSDEPLPPTRTVWLQQKGFSGNLGMSLKAMVGTTDSWLDVTPVTRAEIDHMAPNEERSIQRDLKRFAKKATGRLRNHTPRETHMVRIPAASQDGYFRIVLCATPDGGKRGVLCGSPVFRIASTSSDVSIMRGAGIRAMPLEVGVKVASTIGSAMVSTYVGAAAGAARSGAGRAITSKVVRKVGAQAYKGYEMTGAGDAVRGSWQNSRTARYERAVSSAMMESTVGIIGGDQGPDMPFPLKLKGKVVKGSGYTMERYGFSTANLAGVDEEITMRLTGWFAAWVMVMMPKQKGVAGGEDVVDEEWCEAVVRIGPAHNAIPSVVVKNVVAVHILQDFDGATFYNSSLKVLLMGFLHPLQLPLPPQHHHQHHPQQGGVVVDDEVDVFLQRHADDILTTMATLARPRWSPHETVARMKTTKSNKTWSERLDGVTGSVSARVDRVPMHRAGIRSEAGALRDVSVGNGGLWIQR